jgi:Right handed beta helix region
VLMASPSPAAGTVTCAKYASPSGSDSSAGSASAPWRSAQYLVDHLSSGETGCLFGGSYVGNVSVSRSGVSLVSVPGQRARVLGYVLVRNTADGVTLQDFDVDGHDVSNVTVQVLGDGVTLRGLDITNRNKAGTSYNGICLAAGYGFEQSAANTAVDLTVAASRIHNCGDDGHEHAIYLESTRNARIVDNYLYDNPGYGLLFYPDAQGTVAEYNLIDGNSGQCRSNISFSGESPGGEYSQPHSSSNNVVRYSLITISRCRYNVESFYPTGTAGVGNVVESSCVWSAPYGNFNFDDGGYSERNNRNSDPLYVDRAAKNFALQSGSPCTGYGPRSGAAPPSSTTSTTSTTTSSTTTTTPTTSTSGTTTTVARPDFALTVTPSSRSVVRGGSTLFTVNVTPLNGFAALVGFSLTGLPKATSWDVTPNPASSAATLAVQTTPLTKQGWYTLRVTGVAGALTHTATVRLQVARR